MAKYPGVIPTLNEIFLAIDYVDWTNAAKWGNLRAELRAALVELGTDPAGTFATVKARLDAILPHFNDRGDPAAVDFSLGDLTTDETWRDLDLSGVAPAGTTAVCLKLRILDDLVAKAVFFRKNGNTNTINIVDSRTQVANAPLISDVVVAVDSNRVIEYWASNVAWTSIEITVKGWWK